MWERGRVVPKRGVVDLVDEDAEESNSLVTRVGLELRLDIEDECGGDGGEQTSLLPLSARVHQEFRRETYEDEGRIQIPIVFIHELLIVISSFLAVTLIEFAPGILLSRW